MSRERLSSLLAHLAEDVEPIQHHEHSHRAWTAARTRRRHRAMVGAAAAVVLVAVPVAVAQLDDPQPVRPGPSGTYVGAVRVDSVPTVLEHVTPEGWPTALNPPADAPTLTQRRVQRPLLAFQPHWAGPIYLYSQLRTGDPGMNVEGWVRLDVPLHPTRDADGNEASPLDVNALAHGGEYVAFAQPDEYVIVEPATGEVRRFPLPGLNEEVAWLPGVDHRLLVSGADRTMLVSTDPANGTVPVSDPSAYEVVLAPNDNGELVSTLTLDAGTLRLRQFPMPERVPTIPTVITSAPGFASSMLVGRGWASGDRIAQGVNGRIGSQLGGFVVIVDTASRRVTHVLDTSAQAPRCCAVIGWLDQDSVLVRTNEGVLAWHLPTGAVTMALAHADGLLSLAP